MLIFLLTGRRELMFCFDFSFDWEKEPAAMSGKKVELVIYPNVKGKMTPSVADGRRREFERKLGVWVKSPGGIVPLPSPPPSMLVSLPSQVLQKKM